MAGGAAYMLGPVLALTVMGSFWGLSVQIVLFRERGVLRRFRLAPVGAGPMLGSGILSNYVLTLPTLALEILLARWLFGIEQLGNLWAVFLLVTMGVFTFAAMGLIVASVTNTMQETQVINNAIWFIFLFLSGATVPLAALPEWVQRVAVFLPATYLVNGLQQAIVNRASAWQVTPELIVLAGGTLTAFLISLKLFRWEPEEKVTRAAKLWAVAAAVPFLAFGAWENATGTLRKDALEMFEQIRRPALLQQTPPQEPPAPPAETPPEQ